ncbi:MAG: hypothetical protein L0Y56_01810, partial [Nitrospira sp.]|nr:hypothetical protein [Nitrospira sp.]
MIEILKKVSRYTGTFLMCLLIVHSWASAQEGKKITRRVKFGPDRTTAVLKGTIKQGGEVEYVLRASKGQTLLAHLTSNTNDAVFSIKGPGGASLMGDDVDTDWSGELTEMGDYRITVGTIESKVSEYTLEVTIKTLPSTAKSSDPVVASAVFSTKPDGESPTTTFAPDTEKLYCYVTLDGDIAGTKVTARWVAVETQATEPNHEIDRSPIVMEKGWNVINFSLSKPNNGFPPGKYRVDLYFG